jgi:hypothetical protein
MKPRGDAADDPLVKSGRRPAGTVTRRWVKLTVAGGSADWWRALKDARARGEAPAVLEPLADGSTGELVVAEEDWRKFHQFAKKLPGWAERDGTEQITAEPVEDSTP